MSDILTGSVVVAVVVRRSFELLSVRGPGIGVPPVCDIMDLSSLAVGEPGRADHLILDPAEIGEDSDHRKCWT